MITYQIIEKNKLKYRSGYDIHVVYTDFETNKKYYKIFYFKCESEPSDNDLTDRIDHIKNNVQNMIIEEANRKPEVDRAQIEEILVEKGFLETGQHIEDLKTLEDLLGE